MTLTGFLEARLAEDEAEARRGDGQDFVPTGYWDNTRVLAEVAAKRAAVDAAWSDHERIEGEWGSCQSREQMDAKNDCPDVLRHLAAVYADHPDYDEEWQPR